MSPRHLPDRSERLMREACVAALAVAARRSRDALEAALARLSETQRGCIPDDLIEELRIAAVQREVTR